MCVGGGGGELHVCGGCFCVCVCAPVFVADMSVCTSERMCVSPCTCVSGSCLCTHLTMHVCECVLLVYTSHHACV